MRPSEALAARLDEVREVIARYPVRNPRVFGSAARGEDGEGSDLDILVDPAEETTYFDLAGLEEDLGAVLGVPVDVLTPGGLSARAAESAHRDARPLGRAGAGRARAAVGRARTCSATSCSGASGWRRTSRA